MDRVIITQPFVGIYYMQVCAVEDATDIEILDIANKRNPSATTAGWSRVIRKKEFKGDNRIPTECADYPNRMHFLVAC